MATMIAKTATRVATTALVGTIARGVLGSIVGGGRAAPVKFQPALCAFGRAE